MQDSNKELIEKFGKGRDEILDIGEALNLLGVYGEKCELCIHSSIREQVYKQFKKDKA